MITIKPGRGKNGTGFPNRTSHSHQIPELVKISKDSNLQARKQDWIFGVSSTLLCCIILLPLLWYGFGVDQGIFSYAAWLWRKFGHPPYSYCFDQAFPGIFLIHYFAQEALGESVTAFRVLDLAWQTGTALVIFLTVRLVFQSRWSGLLASIMYALVYVKLGPWDTGQRDGFFPLLYLGSFLLVRSRGSSVVGKYSALFAGLLMGFAFLLKPVAVLPGLLLLTLILRTAKNKPLAGFCFFSGAGLASAAVFIYYLQHGALQDLYQALFEFNARLYAGSQPIPAGLKLKGILLVRLWPHNLAVLAGAMLLAISWRKLKVLEKSPACWLLLILAATYAGYVAQGRYFIYHQAPVWGMLTVFAGPGWIFALKSRLDERRILERTRAAFLLLLMVLVSASMVSKDLAWFAAKAATISPDSGQRTFDYYRVCWRAACYLELRTRPEQTIQVWGGEALVNYLAQRRSATRFAQTFPLLLKPGSPSGVEFQQKLAQEFLDSIRQAPPAYFVVETMPHPGFGIASDKSVLIENYPGIWNFITANYVPESSIGFMEFYRRLE